MSTTANTIHETAPETNNEAREMPILSPPTPEALRVSCPVCEAPAGEDCGLGPFRAYRNGTIHTERLLKTKAAQG